MVNLGRRRSSKTFLDRANLGGLPLAAKQGGICKVKVAVLDDYQLVAESMADWSELPDGTEVSFFQDHLVQEDQLVERLKDFQVVMGMRERTPFPRSLLARLPQLRLLVTTGARNAVFDVENVVFDVLDDENNVFDVKIIVSKNMFCQRLGLLRIYFTSTWNTE